MKKQRHVLITLINKISKRIERDDHYDTFLLNQKIWKSKVQDKDTRAQGNYNRTTENETTYEHKSEER